VALTGVGKLTDETIASGPRSPIPYSPGKDVMWSRSPLARLSRR
jgi:hypothetical protein